MLVQLHEDHLATILSQSFSQIQTSIQLSPTFSHQVSSHCLQRHAQEMEHQALLSIQLNKPCDVRKLMGFLKAKGTIHSIHAADIEAVIQSCPWVYNN
jgi:hypothetical protein